MANSSKALHITQALKDWVVLCNQTQTDYRVIGSVAVAGALGKLHRTPADVDVLYDQRNEAKIYSGLKKKGYNYSSVGNPGNLFQKELPRFTKGRSVIEPRKANFSGEQIKINLLAPIPFIPQMLKPRLTLKFGKTMSEGVKYNFNGVKFTSLKREALYGILTTLRTLKRKEDFRVGLKETDKQLLSNNLDAQTMEKIYRERPGVYLKWIPVITLSRN